MDWISTNEWLEEVRGALVQEGFRNTAFQDVKRGQVFGLVGKLDNVWEMHVRGFVDGTLESEIEVSRDYLEHLNDNYRQDATPELIQILNAYHIHYRPKRSLPQLDLMLEPPKRLTPWKPALVAILILLIFYIVS